MQWESSGIWVKALLTATFLAAILWALVGQYATIGGEPAMSENKEASESIVFGMGCFWGAEKRMAALPGVLDVVSGYAGGDYPDPTYERILESEYRRGVRNHAEVVQVFFDPTRTSVGQLLAGFWENHDPTQGDRQGNDVGSNYRSAIYYSSDAQRQAAEMTRDSYQGVLTAAGFGAITTEIAPLDRFYPAEDYHQDYLIKNPRGYCGLGGTGVAFPTGLADAADGGHQPPDPTALNPARQLIVFESEHCPFCEQFRQDILAGWSSPVAVASSLSPRPPAGWQLAEELWATPTIVLFEDGKERARYTGYSGEPQRFWDWLGLSILSEDEIRVAYQNGTERPFTGSLLDNKQQGSYVDPVTGAPLFRSGSKFDSGSGWPSFFQPVQGAVTLHQDGSFGMRRVEVRSASSGIHLGHVFDDGPAPTGKRYCINSNVLRFVPDDASAVVD
jgi:peptide methionine sulfoxide reductase msrA/msrB